MTGRRYYTNETRFNCPMKNQKRHRDILYLTSVDKNVEYWKQITTICNWDDSLEKV